MSLSGEAYLDKPLKRAAVKIGKGNMCLVNAEYAQAVELFTEVLTKISPGHACAFLSRGLAYLLLDYPELAVMDFFRADFVADIAIIEGVENQWRDQIAKFLKFTNKAQDDRKESWTVVPTCFVGQGQLPWLNKKLASIRIFLPGSDITDQAVLRKIAWTSILRATNISNFCSAIKIKANYLLALSLYQLGGGAVKSALDVIVEALEIKKCTKEDREQFYELDSEIYSNMARQQNEEKSEGNPSLRRTSNLMINELMDTSYTRVPRHLYPWDTYNYIPKIGVLNGRLDRINRTALEGNKNVSIRGSTKSVLDLHLCVEEGFTDEQDEIFTELSTFMVGSIDSKLLRDTLVCEGCAADLTVSSRLRDRARDQAYRKIDYSQAHRGVVSLSPASQPEPVEPVQDADAIVIEVNEVDDDQDDSFSTLPELKSDATHGVPERAESIEAIPEDNFRVCDSCMDVYFCSGYCHKEATGQYHADICGLSLDHCVWDFSSSREMLGLPSPHEQRITCLLLLRMIARTSLTSRNPLAHPCVQMLNLNCEEAASVYRHCNFTPASLHYTFPDRYNSKNQALRFPETPRSVDHLAPWHFDVNVRRPFRFLWKIGGIKLALDVINFDGWMVNTMILKIIDNMEVTFGPRFEKVYEDAGSVLRQRTTSRYSSFSEYVMGETRQMIPDFQNVDERFHERQLWVGSLYPLASLLRVEGKGKHGLPANCALYERGGIVICRPLGRQKDDRKDSAMEVLIKPGDLLVREYEIRQWIEEGDDMDDEVEDESMDLEEEEQKNAVERARSRSPRRVISREMKSIDTVMMDAIETEQALSEMPNGE